jgi:ApbE superfamily uncharacterized protein (UPF0280 family)
MKRNIREFHYKDAHFHIHTSAWDVVTSRILEDRHNLEAFIRNHPDFSTSLTPLNFSPEELTLAPESVRRMHKASLASGLGPMAAVAGTMAQLAAEESRRCGSLESIVENGGDLFLDCREEVVLGLYTGNNHRFGPLALQIPADRMPLAVCSSSGRMGHSLSLGDADVVTVFSENASLADAVATLGGNLVTSGADIEEVLNRLVSIKGILGVLIIRDDKFGAVGDLPEIIRSADPDLKAKVSRDEQSNL